MSPFVDILTLYEVTKNQSILTVNSQIFSKCYRYGLIAESLSSHFQSSMDSHSCNCSVPLGILPSPHHIQDPSKPEATGQECKHHPEHEDQVQYKFQVPDTTWGLVQPGLLPKLFSRDYNLWMPGCHPGSIQCFWTHTLPVGRHQPIHYGCHVPCLVQGEVS